MYCFSGFEKFILIAFFCTNTFFQREKFWFISSFGTKVSRFWGKLWNLKKHPTFASVGFIHRVLGIGTHHKWRRRFGHAISHALKSSQKKKSLTYLYLVIYCEDFKPIVVNGSKQFSNFWNRLYVHFIGCACKVWISPLFEKFL